MIRFFRSTGILFSLLFIPATHAANLSDTTVTSADELRQAMSEVGPDDKRVIRLNGGRLDVPPGTGGSNPCPPDLARDNAALPLVAGQITFIGNDGTLAGVEGAILPFCVAPKGDLTIRNLTITGFGGPSAPDAEDAVLKNSGRLTLDSVTIQGNGRPPTDDAFAAGSIVTNRDGGTLEIVNSVFIDNSAGSAILQSHQDLTIRNSSIVGNDLYGSRIGALKLTHGGSADIVNATISGNSAGVFAAASDIVMEHVTIVDNEAGIRSQGDSGLLLLRNSIVADNGEVNCLSSPAWGIAFDGTNLVDDESCRLDPDSGLVGIDPELRPLRVLANGMPGHVPRPSSPVLDRGDEAFCPFRDAVGRVRNTAADGDKRCTLGAIEPPNQPPDFEIDARLTGTWFDPEHDGHYLSVQVLPDDRVAAIWWTYDPDGNPLWLVGSGPVDGGSALLPVHRSSGMSLPSLDDSLRDMRPWGTLELDFEDCWTMTLSWQAKQPGFEDGSADLQRLTFNDGLRCR